jgi:hypothetical protein
MVAAAGVRDLWGGGGGHGFGGGGGHGFEGGDFNGRGFGRGGFGGHGFSTSFADVSGRGFGSGFRGGVDLRTEGFLVGETTVASVIVVSVDEIAISATAGFAILMGTFSILASMALDTHITIHTITIHTITHITIHILLTATAPI